MVPVHQVRVGAPSRGAEVDKPPSVPRPGHKARVCEAVVPPGVQPVLESQTSLPHFTNSMFLLQKNGREINCVNHCWLTS